MKQVVIFIAALWVWAVWSVNANAWDLKVDKNTLSIKQECIVIDINAKTQIQVCKCGSVSVQEWKEIVRNKDTSYVTWGTTTGIVIRDDSGMTRLAQ